MYTSAVVFCCVALMVLSTSASYSMDFSTYSYTAGSTTVNSQTISYNLYQNVVYVAEPVDKTYESMNVFVPTAIGSTSVDTTNVPILFVINVGGYSSSSTWGNTMLQDTNGQLALAAGYVVVTPGCRGRDNVDSSGNYYGKAPAAIVDLKSAVRFIRYNKGTFPGNVNWIVSSGSSAGGALSSLLGASGTSTLYDDYFTELGAANAADNIFASGVYCPITDLNHADMAYEWELGSCTLSSTGSVVNQTISNQLSSEYPAYLNSLSLTGQSNFGTITTDNYQTYLLNYYLIPSATEYLSDLSDSARTSYLAQNSWITWSDGTASFTFSEYLDYIGRSKSVPAFDVFDLSSAECIEFGNETVNARHFTNFSLQYTSGDSTAIISAELAPLVNEMNPMYFITNENSGCAGNWWIRHGTKDTDTSLPVIIDLATSLENLGNNVNTWLYWDAGHGVNEDPDEFIAWIAGITSSSQSSSGISTNSASSYNKAGSYSSVSSGANAQASSSIAEDGDYACRCVFDSWCELIVVLLAALMF